MTSMSYILKKPKDTNLLETAWNMTETETKWSFWVAIPLFFILGHFAFIVLVIPVIRFFFLLNKVRASFWKEFAEINGWEYRNVLQPGNFGLVYGDPSQESGLIFRGYDRSISNEITGVIEGRSFRIFSYQFSSGADKHKTTHQYTIFAFKFSGSFPHILLNNEGNSWSIDIGERVPLPTEFGKKFSLFAPRKYEIEALEIFTPDIFANLLEKEFTCDVELIGQEALIVIDGHVNSSKELEKTFNTALALEELLDERLDKFKFSQIGDLPSTLEE